MGKEGPLGKPYVVNTLFQTEERALPPTSEFQTQVQLVAISLPTLEMI